MKKVINVVLEVVMWCCIFIAGVFIVLERLV